MFYWIFSLLFSFLFFQLFGLGWAIGFFLYCLFKKESVAKSSGDRDMGTRTSGGFSDALVFFGLFSLINHSGSHNDHLRPYDDDDDDRDDNYRDDDSHYNDSSHYDDDDDDDDDDDYNDDDD